MVEVRPEKDGPGISDLARVAIVDVHGHKIYHSYSKPLHEVTDYRQATSGIQEHHIRDATPFHEVRREVLRVVEGKTLIAHSIEHDLAALEITDHPLIIDTFALSKKLGHYQGGRSLQSLVSYYLEGENQNFQSGEHCPIEDARATMKVYFAMEKRLAEQKLDQQQKQQMRGKVQSSLRSALFEEGTSELRQQSSSGAVYCKNPERIPRADEDSSDPKIRFFNGLLNRGLLVMTDGRNVKQPPDTPDIFKSVKELRDFVQIAAMYEDYHSIFVSPTAPTTKSGVDIFSLVCDNADTWGVVSNADKMEFVTSAGRNNRGIEVRQPQPLRSLKSVFGGVMQSKVFASVDWGIPLHLQGAILRGEQVSSDKFEIIHGPPGTVRYCEQHPSICLPCLTHSSTTLLTRYAYSNTKGKLIRSSSDFSLSTRHLKRSSLPRLTSPF
jgi:DNA polymerase III epsilon subunit-like protein